MIGIQKPEATVHQAPLDSERDSERDSEICKILCKIDLLFHALRRTAEGIPDEEPVGAAVLLRLRENLDPVIATRIRHLFLVHPKPHFFVCVRKIRNWAQRVAFVVQRIAQSINHAVRHVHSTRIATRVADED